MTYKDWIILETNTPKQATSEDKTIKMSLHLLTPSHHNDTDIPEDAVDDPGDDTKVFLMILLIILVFAF